MSSRNMRLSTEERESAAQIYATLKFATENWTAYDSVEALEKACTVALNAIPHLNVEYVTCSDQRELQRITKLDPKVPARIFAAVQCGKVRLIDNLPLF